MYAERPSMVAGCTLWSSRVPVGAESRVVPDGCTDIMWIDGELLVAGPYTEPHVHSSSTSVPSVGIRFDPGVGPRCLGVSGGELRDRRVHLEEIWPARVVSELFERLAEGAPPEQELESAVARVLPPPTLLDDRLAGVVSALRSGGTLVEATEAAAFSERQLRRIAFHAFGYGLKTLQRVLRLQRAISLASSGDGLATAAHRAGYSDQAHMTREVRALSGLSPAMLLN